MTLCLRQMHVLAVTLHGWQSSSYWGLAGRSWGGGGRGGLKRSILGWGGGTYISPKGVCDSLVKNREMFFSLITLWSCFKQAKKLDHPNLDHMHKERQSKLPPQDFWHLSNVSPIFMENSKTEVTGRYSFKNFKGILNAARISGPKWTGKQEFTISLA